MAPDKLKWHGRALQRFPREQDRREDSQSSAAAPQGLVVSPRDPGTQESVPGAVEEGEMEVADNTHVTLSFGMSHTEGRWHTGIAFAWTDPFQDSSGCSRDRACAEEVRWGKETTSILKRLARAAR